MIFLKRKLSVVDQIIKFPTDPIRLTSTDDSFFHYEIILRVNVREAIKFGATCADLKISTGLSKKNAMFDPGDKRHPVKKITTRDKKLSRIYTQNLNKLISHQVIDLTRAIPNSAVNQSKRQIYKDRVFKYVRSRALQNNSIKEVSIIHPNPQIPHDAPLSGESSKFTNQSISRKVKSPLSNLANAESSLDPRNYATGCIPHDRTKIDLETYRRFFKSPKNPYIAAASSQSRVVVSKVTSTRFRRMKFNFSIERNVINEKSGMAVFVTLKNSKGRSIGETKFRIDNFDLAAYQGIDVPVKPPSLYVCSKGTEPCNYITVQNRDKRVKSVSILKKVINSDMSSKDQSFQFEQVGRVTLSSANDVKSIVDPSNGYNPTVYRAIPETSSLISLGFIESVAPPKKRSTLSYNRNSVGFRVQQLSPLIIGVLSNSDDVVSVGLQKRNRTIFEKDFYYVDKKSPRKLMSSLSDPVFFNDNTAINPGHIYEYRAKIYYSSCIEEISKNSFIWQAPLVPLESGLFTKIVSASGVGSKTKIELNTISSPTYTDVLAEAIKSRNIEESSVEISDLQSDNPVKAFIYRVNRTDLFSGDVVNFGVVKGDVFSEKDFSEINSSNPLVSGRSYRYDVFTDKVDIKASGVSVDPTRSATDPLTGVSYKYDATKYDHPTAIREGTISTKESRSSKLGNSESSYFTSGDPVVYKVSVSEKVPKILSSVATPLKFKTVNIKWYVENSKNVDHFIVKRNLPGNQKIVAAVHANDSGKMFQIIDHLKGVLLGATIIYEIFLVDKNMKILSSKLSNSIRLVDHGH